MYIFVVRQCTTHLHSHEWPFSGNSNISMFNLNVWSRIEFGFITLVYENYACEAYELKEKKKASNKTVTW